MGRRDPASHSPHRQASSAPTSSPQEQLPQPEGLLQAQPLSPGGALPQPQSLNPACPSGLSCDLSSPWPRGPHEPVSPRHPGSPAAPGTPHVQAQWGPNAGFSYEVCVSACLRACWHPMGFEWVSVHNMYASLCVTSVTIWERRHRALRENAHVPRDGCAVCSAADERRGSLRIQAAAPGRNVT